MFKISSDARDYIIKNGGALTIRVVKGGGCCATLYPMTETVRPTVPEEYLLLQADGVDLYLQKGVNVRPGGINIVLNRLLIMKKLDVQGLDLM